MTKKTVLVVGGAGFIGSHVNKMLVLNGYHTLVLDNLSTGNQKAIVSKDFIQGDIADTPLLERIFKENRIDVVMHFAAFTDVGESVQNPLKYYQNNVCHTLNLLEAMQRHAVNIFIFSSSAAIFGIPPSDSITEKTPSFPINPYGRTKLMVENILKDFDQAYGMKSCCLRYFNAAGGDPTHVLKNYKKKENNLIPIILKELKKEEGCVKIFGTDYPTPDGTCIRDYIHIWDIAAAHIAAMEQLISGKNSSQYNLGNGQGFSVREVIQTAFQVTGKTIPVIEAERRPGDPPILVANAQKACQELHWKPLYKDLEIMLKHAWQALI